jgi:hypothetical protein
VRVVSERSVIPWLMGASVLIHNGCTTAVEAAVLGRPTITFKPVTRKGFDFELPDSLSHETYDRDELVATTRRIVDGDPAEASGEPLRREILDRHLAALDGPLAADRMVSALTAAGFAGRRYHSESLYTYWQARRRLAIRNADKREAAAVPGDRNTRAYHDHRFPGTTVAELEERIRRFGDQLGRFEGLEVTCLADHIFRIRR